MISGTQYRRWLILAAPLGLVVVALTTSWAGQASLPAGQVPAISATPAASGTPAFPTLPPDPTDTPTSMPGPPSLISPENFAQLPQPVPPDQWEFVWEAREGPCFCILTVDGPQGFGFSTTVWPDQGYHYTYTRAEPLPDDALIPWSWGVGVSCPLGSNVSETYAFSVSPVVWPATSTPTPTLIPTPTATRTSIPGPPTLVAPEDHAELPQPVSPEQWDFVWEARPDPCYSKLIVDGPGTYGFAVYLFGDVDGYHYTYIREDLLPEDALTPWYWWTKILCPMGETASEVRSFSVAPYSGPAFQILMPGILSGD